MERLRKSEKASYAVISFRCFTFFNSGLPSRNNSLILGVVVSGSVVVVVTVVVVVVVEVVVVGGASVVVVVVERSLRVSLRSPTLRGLR